MNKEKLPAQLNQNSCVTHFKVLTHQVKIPAVEALIQGIVPSCK